MVIIAWGYCVFYQVGNKKMPTLNSDENLRPDESSDPSSPVKSSTRIAILGIETLNYKVHLNKPFYCYAQ